MLMVDGEQCMDCLCERDHVGGDDDTGVTVQRTSPAHGSSEWYKLLLL